MLIVDPIQRGLGDDPLEILVQKYVLCMHSNVRNSLEAGVHP